jgi:hypothetical protein
MGNKADKAGGGCSSPLPLDQITPASDEDVTKYFDEDHTFSVSGCIDIAKLKRSLGIDPKVYVAYQHQLTEKFKSGTV